MVETRWEWRRGYGSQAVSYAAGSSSILDVATEGIHMEINVTVTETKTVRPKLLCLHLKVCDMFTAELKDEAGNTIKEQDDGYVPSFMPGEHYGDYVILNIDVTTGQVTNWDPAKFQRAVGEWIEGDDE